MSKIWAKYHQTCTKNISRYFRFVFDLIWFSKKHSFEWLLINFSVFLNPIPLISIGEFPAESLYIKYKSIGFHENPYFLFENEDGSLSGVWQRTANGILPFLLFLDKAPVYRKRFRFFEMANRTINKHMEKNFEYAMDYALASSLRMKRVA